MNIYRSGVVLSSPANFSSALHIYVFTHIDLGKDFPSSRVMVPEGRATAKQLSPYSSLTPYNVQIIIILTLLSPLK